jgi:HSP20 family molecular chaperone IbpA
MNNNFDFIFPKGLTSDFFISKEKKDSYYKERPSVVIREEDGILIKIAAPGFTKSDVKAFYSNDILSITGNVENDVFWGNNFKKEFSVNKKTFNRESTSVSVRDGIINIFIKYEKEDKKTYDIEVK